MRGVATFSILFLLASSSAGAARSCATLALADSSPLTIRGAGFKPGERVKVVVTGSVSLTRIARAGSEGRILAGFKQSVGRCDPILVRAVGDRGSRARIDLTHLACAPAP